MKITIIGTGYVGLVTGACLSELGHKVTCIDKDKENINNLTNLKIPFYEKGLKNLIKKNYSKDRIKFSTKLSESFKDSKVIIIAVGTPFKKNVDLRYIRESTREVGNLLSQKLNNYKVICIKSTVEPGTTAKIVKKILEKESKKSCFSDFGLSMNPEFLAEGSAIKDFMFPDRIVIGSEDNKTKKIMHQMYSKFKHLDFIDTNLNTAELIKYTSNSYFAMNISFANEISKLSNLFKNVDVIDILKGLHLDKRLSPIKNNKRISPGLVSFLHPGIGFGGSCFPKDIKTITSFAKRNNVTTPLLNSIITINKNQYLKLFIAAEKNIKNYKNKKISVLGLSFKPGTTDVRESPSFNIIKHLINKGAKVCAHDPMAIDEFSKKYKHKNLIFEKRLDCILKFSKIIFLLTSWPEYKTFIKKNKNKDIILVDGRRFISKDNVKSYCGIGI